MPDGPKPLSRDAVERVYRLSPLQAGMLYHDLMTPDTPPYMRQVVLTLEGFVDPVLCETVWNMLLARHALLRSVFDYEKTEQPLQIVLKKQTIDFSFEDARRDGFAAVERWRLADRQRSFDLRHDRLFRVALFGLGVRRYAMVWSHPHILLDGWSGAILADEFTALYVAARQGIAPSLPRPPNPESIMSALAARDDAKSLRYWAILLEGYEELATLPRRHDVNSGGVDVAHAVRHFRFEESETHALRALAARHGATLSLLLQALWGLLLGRWTGRRDIVFGIVVSGRSVATTDAMRLVGMLINSIPVRLRWETLDTIGDILGRLSAQAANSGAHDQIGLAAIQGLPDVPSTLLDHLIVVENYPAAGLDAGAAGFAITGAEAEERANYEFGVLFHDGACLDVTLEYDSGCFSAAQMERIEQYFRGFATSVLANPVAPLKDHDGMPLAEACALSDIGQGPIRPIAETDLVSLWHRQVDKTPGNCALVEGCTQLSYRDLDALAEGIANRLRAAGVKPGEAVGLFCGRSVERIAGLLGVLKAGGVYLPLSQKLPDRRIGFMLDDAQCRHVLAIEEGAAQLRAIRPDLTIHIAEGLPAAGRVVRHEAPDNLAYIIYTSGSTGQPKGVAIEHRGFVNMILAQIDGFGIQPDDRVLQFASCSFDASLSEIFMALLSGATLVMVPEAAIRNGTALLTLMKQQEVTVATLPPSYLRALENGDFGPLRVLITAGEAADPVAVSRHATRMRVFNAYGPSEASVCASWHEVQQGRDYRSGVPIGRSIANTRMTVRDDLGRLMPFGSTGEIYLEGAGLARGYVRQCELAAERFPVIDGARMYRTGDAGTVLDDGEILYAGRLDGQVKLNGYRIELGEIEHCLQRHPGIAQAVALVVPNPARIAAFVVLCPGSALPEPENLRRAMAEELPPWMIPSAIVPVAALPLTLAGKIDRSLLAAMLPASNTLFGSGAAPLGATEALVAKAFASVLGGGPYGPDCSFAEAGGDSLGAIRLLGRLRRDGFKLELRDMLAAGTIAAIARVLQHETSEEETFGNDTSVSGNVPLTPIQRWFFSVDPEGSAQLAHNRLLRLGQRAAPEIVASAMSAMYRHHDALHLRFRRDTGAWTSDCQTPEKATATRHVDLRQSRHPEADLVADAELHAPGAAADNSQLFHATHYQLPDADYVLLAAHHLVVDAVSWRILIEDLSLALQQARAKQGIRLPGKTTSWRDWALTLAAKAALVEAERERPYWETMARATGPSAPRIAPHSYYETEVVTANAGPVTSGLSGRKSLARLLACLGEALHEWDGRRATSLTLTSHGRHALLPGMDLSRTVGWFQADYPFRLDRLSTEHEIEAALEAVPSQGVGWGILRWLSPAPPAHDEPDIAVNYLGAVDLSEDGDFKLSALLPSASTRGFRRMRSIEVEAFTSAGGLHLAIRYAPHILSSAAIHMLKDTMIRCLQARYDSDLGLPGQYTEITQSILGSTHVS